MSGFSCPKVFCTWPPALNLVFLYSFHLPSPVTVTYKIGNSWNVDSNIDVTVRKWSVLNQFFVQHLASALWNHSDI